MRIAGPLEGQDLLEDQVAVTDDAEHVTVVVDHRQRAHVMLAESLDQLVEGGGLVGDHDVSGHHVLHGPLHGDLPWGATGAVPALPGR